MSHRPLQTSETTMLLEMVQVLRDEPEHDVAGRRIDEIERRFVTAAEPGERLELQRFAARIAFIAATDKGAPFEAVSERFRARCALGFEDVFSELAVLLEFAHACGDFGEREAGLSVLEQARARLGGSGMTPRSPFVRQQSTFIEACRRRLEGRE
jgi:hypothetical protein